MPDHPDRPRRVDSVGDSPTESANESLTESPGDSARVAEEEAAEVVERDLASLSAERDDYLATLRRVQADFENYRKRVIKEQTALVERASEDVANFRKGIELLHAELLGVLEKSGLARIEADGKPFDPNVHEAVTFGEGEDGKVVSVVQKGYKLGDRVIRPAMVVVGKSG